MEAVIQWLKSYDDLHFIGAVLSLILIYKIRWWIHVKADAACTRAHLKVILKGISSEEDSNEYSTDVLNNYEDFYGSHRIQNRVSDMVGSVLTWSTRFLFLVLFIVTVFLARSEGEKAFSWILPVGAIVIYSVRAAAAYFTYLLTFRYPGQAAVVREEIEKVEQQDLASNHK